MKSYAGVDWGGGQARRARGQRDGRAYVAPDGIFLRAEGLSSTSGIVLSCAYATS
jgi:hypothetical protein